MNALWCGDIPTSVSASYSLGFTGDLMLGRQVDALYGTDSRPPAAIWGNLQPTLRGFDGLFASLACSLTSAGDPWDDRRFQFRADPEWSTAALRAATVDCCTLTSPHLLDLGAVGLDETLSVLTGADIEAVGAGRSLAAASTPTAVDCRGLTVAVVAFAEATASPDDAVTEIAATDNRPGIARVAFDPSDDNSMAVIRSTLSATDRFDPDLVVASLRWETTSQPQPTARHQRFAQQLADWGVDFVVGHGGRSFRGIELLDRGNLPTVVCYGLGDFVADYAIDPIERNDRCVLFELVVDSDGRLLELTVHPAEIESKAVYRASDRGATWCRQAMIERSAPFGTEFERAGRGLRLSINN